MSQGDGDSGNVFYIDHINDVPKPEELHRARGNHPTAHVKGTPPPRGESQEYQTLNLVSSVHEGPTIDQTMPSRGEVDPDSPEITDQMSTLTHIGFDLEQWRSEDRVA